MEKYYVTCDIEKTSKIKQNITPILWDEMTSIRDNISYLINSSFWNNTCEIINFDNICDFFESKRKENEFIISLDNWIYIPKADYYFDSTRIYNSKEDILNNPKNYQIKQRNWNNISEQMKSIIDTYENSWKNEIIICDDWIFSWDTLNDVLKLLQKNWIDVSEIRVILNFSNNTNLWWIKIESMYKDDKCKDWVDERDFFYWVNMSWATFIDNSWKISWIPYISSRGIAEKKASINKETSKYFCHNMIEENIKFWDKMIKKNGSEIILWDIPRISFLEDLYGKSKNIIDVLTLEKEKI